MNKEKYYDPLSDMGMIKDGLMSLFCHTKDISNLIMPNLDNENFSFEENWYGGSYENNIYGEKELTTLIGHCFDFPYIEGTVTDTRCAIFIETYLMRVSNSHIKRVGVDIFIVAHKSVVKLSTNERQHFESLGIYGNRVDCATQIINSTINDKEIMKNIKEKYSIGDLVLSENNPVSLYIPGTNFYGKKLSYIYDSFYQRKDYIR